MFASSVGPLEPNHHPESGPTAVDGDVKGQSDGYIWSPFTKLKNILMRAHNKVAKTALWIVSDGQQEPGSDTITNDSSVKENSETPSDTSGAHLEPDVEGVQPNQPPLFRYHLVIICFVSAITVVVIAGIVYYFMTN
uniref:Uncharacterized protein n=1 Tax=Spongospora subterranea TaxID=70186 RepID=A0A0H5R732_9EUKA|eukprot:CRZ04104.1 hypothetical protein [Spongospora subterranea]